ncbi:MAG TPA: hypothetical protein VL137_03265 [Polyangiaceae bacterium]|nr:hypothetical protein [Polyangiaceae bacterium]
MVANAVASLFASLFAGSSGPLDFLFTTWKGAFFENDNFRNNFLTPMAIGLSLTTAALFMIERRARFLGQPFTKKTARTVGIILTVLGVITYFDWLNPNVRYPNYYHRHEFYHYYMGSKYFEEVGYQRLYECTAVAEVELGFGDKLKKQELRDLRVNLITPITNTYVFSDPDQCKSHFKPERWDLFKTDIKWFEESARGDYWDNMKKDHGYNPPPVWTMSGKFFSSFAPAGDGFFKLLSLIDVAFHIGIIVLLGWAFGWRVMTVGSVFWGCNAVANFYWTGGAFMRQDWVFFIVASVCLARKRYFGLSGAALMWSALLRVFPVVSFFGAGVIVALDLFRNRRIRPDFKRWIAGAAIALAVLVPASMAVCGVDSYKAFATHIGRHRATPLTNHMGLETILSHSWSGRMRFTQDDRLDDPFEGWKDGRIERVAKLKWLQDIIVLFIAGWIAWALRRTKLIWVGIALSAPLTITLLNLTCYYYALLVASVVLVRARPALAVALLATSAASQVLHYRFWFIDDKFTAHSYLFYALGLLLLIGYSRPFSVARLKAWLARKPEPRSPQPPQSPKSEHPERVSASA